jgi:hypothetical protein
MVHGNGAQDKGAHNNSEQRFDSIGKTISVVFIVCLFAYFLYAYIPHFLGS